MRQVRVRPLTDAEREILMRWIRSETTPPRLRQRARAVVLSSYGISTYTIAILIPMGRNNVSFWVRRFNEGSVEALYDLPRPGRPRKEGREASGEAGGSPDDEQSK